MNKVLQTLSWHDEGCERINTITASYEHLPLAKKLCFLYFAAFPEDKEIDAKSLLQIWVAERLVPDEVNRTLEETAECFLEDLVQRSLVQVSNRFPDGSIKYCQVHDVLRDLAIHKAKEMNFLMVCSKEDGRESCNMKGKLVLERYEGMPHLKYLQLDTYVRYNDSDVSKFGKWIRSLKYLETLDLRGTDHLKDLSHWIWHGKTLRHVLLCSDVLTPSLELSRTQGPPASVDVKNLQTLQGVKYNKSWNTSVVPDIPEVRELDIRCCPESGVATLANLLCKLKHVVYLQIAGDCDGFFKLRIRDFPFYENLKSLVLIKYDFSLGECLTVSDDMLEMLPPHLTELSLRGFEFVSDPMPMLEKLRSLNTLRISRRGIPNSATVRRITCSAGGFEQLEELVLEDLLVEEWKIEMGAMPMLKRLRIKYCDPLSVPPQLIHLDRLQFLDWVTYVQVDKEVINDIYTQRPHLRRYW
ncbi:Disease resistance protein (CC-NBS-LRR class) family [Rhynchospora pubera]|uniref:Disease resistance protein (CC-NBS-LRR class) family n=1 Tax=Rhynchospora pubera TaxID=906938 RepID=A0AAV8CIC0_9POAL|nr:Disease resistance protein (CC-NBS-LRR class) family [Rhynchospora pubera]